MASAQRRLVSTVGTAMLLAAFALPATGAGATTAGAVGQAVSWSSTDADRAVWSTSGATAVAVGASHMLTLDHTGRVTSHGLSDYYVPESARQNVVAIDAAGDASLALRSDGVVIGWGSYYETAAPRFLSGVKAIAVGPSMGAALKLDGTIETWGLSDYGQHEFSVGLTGATALDVGTYHALAVTAQGTVVGSGGVTGDSAAAHPPNGLTGVRDVAAGMSHSLALKTDGTVVAWGSNTFGESTVPAGLTGVSAIAAGRNQSFALLATGRLVSWGRAGAGRPAVPLGLTNVTAIAAGPHIVAAVTQSPRPTAPIAVSVDASRNPPTVRWQPPTHLGESATGYRVTVSPGGYAVTTSRFARSLRLPRRTNSSAYTVSVAAMTAAGTGSARSVRVLKNDIRMFNPARATWLQPGARPLVFGRAGDKPAVGDYNGDGAADLAVFRPSTGHWLIRGRPAIRFGGRGDIPVPADYNGDGRTDIAVYRPSTGGWHVRGFSTVRLGTRGDIPVPADYSRDGIADVAVFRPSTGVWSWRYSRNDGSIVAAAKRLGRRGDIPTPGDFTRNGQAEPSFYRPSNSTWQPPAGRGVRFGQRGDVPVVGDYNADGKAEFALYRPSTGTWFIRGHGSVRLGGQGFTPIAPR